MNGRRRHLETLKASPDMPKKIKLNECRLENRNRMKCRSQEANERERRKGGKPQGRTGSATYTPTPNSTSIYRPALTFYYPATRICNFSQHLRHLLLRRTCSVTRVFKQPSETLCYSYKYERLPYVLEESVKVSFFVFHYLRERGFYFANNAASPLVENSSKKCKHKG